MNNDTDDFAARCTRLVSASFEAHRLACNAALPDLAAMIRPQAETVYRQCLALGVQWSGDHWDRPNLASLQQFRPGTDAEFRRDAEQWAEEIRGLGGNSSAPEPEDYISRRRGNAEKAWAEVAADLTVLIAENARHLGDTPLPDIAEGGADTGEECSECSDTHSCPSCDGSGEDPETGKACESCSGSGECPDCGPGA